MASPLGSPGAIGEPRPRRVPPLGSPGAIGEPGLRPGTPSGSREQVGPGPNYTPGEVAQRRARFANRQREYARSNTQVSPFRPTAPSGNQFV